jgi:hypothetical protein
MADLGIGGYTYGEPTVKDGVVTFTFVDPEDATNTATVSVDQKDFPNGVTVSSSRQVADYAFLQAQKVLDEKRDARLRKEAADALEQKHAEDARQRDAAVEFLTNAQDLAQTVPKGAAGSSPTDPTPKDNSNDDNKKSK